jgi:hypothetical protein
MQMTNSESSTYRKRLQKPALLFLLGCAALNALANESFVPCSRLGRWRECITVPLASADQDAAAKEFRPPPSDRSKIYIVRSNTIEPKTRSAIFLDDEPVTSLAPMTYIVLEASPGMHRLKARTDHDFEITIDLAPGKTYYVQHHLSLLFNTMTGALKVIDEKEGHSQVVKSKLAKTGMDAH